jgi:hypothetical protein
MEFIWTNIRETEDTLMDYNGLVRPYGKNMIMKMPTCALAQSSSTTRRTIVNEGRYEWQMNEYGNRF